jgi:uncharacterized protein YqeY
MSLEEKITNDIKAAMQAKDKEALNALRAIKSVLLLLKTEKNANVITEEMELTVLQKLVKQRKEAAEIYQSQGREDLYNEEVHQMNIIAKYLPEQMSVEAVEAVIKQLVEQENIRDIKGMGKLMGLASKQLAGKADNKTVSEVIKSILSSKHE